MAHPKVAVSCVSSVYVRHMVFEKTGDIETGHSHQFDHQTLVAKGSVRVSANGKDTVFNAPHCVFIKAGVEHELIALEDDTVCYCIHALRDGTDVCDIVPEGSIPLGASEGEAFNVALPLLHSDNFSLASHPDR
jgi:hypothetical protein